ncbi:hypothetical protein GJU39_01270 [Pedobacter petrophilus]|uniref:Signal transduction histidine kinase internal region domain-containing protein n=1 Tax=Pedobacter petrophilus TaxID=1908241 RepID=A0A7K0FUG8_9SPHI|nr:histidine kinase [Pedobacter petrophilus]MRX74704.1 hypothetical protein [Pedobacter petrophilus]
MKNILKKLKPYKIHIFSWVALIALEILIVGLASGGYGKPGNYFTHYLLNILLFYLCGDVFYPRTFNNGLNWIWRFPLGLTIVFFLYLATSFVLDLEITLHTTWNEIDDLFMDYRFVFRTLWRALQFMGYAGFYFLFKEYQKGVRETQLAREEIFNNSIANKNMEIRLNEAQNSYLKAQINPHLLFNTINYLYQDILKTSPKSANLLMTLSDVMRYSVNCEFEDSTIPLEKEIEQTENLIRLQLSRFESERFINFTYDPIVKRVKFIPLVLITLVENVFKHAKLSDKNHIAEISVTYIDNTIEIRTTNLINKAKKIPSLNTGLKNTRQRLEMAYGKNAVLECNSENGIFSLRLSVSLSN